jgi:outer membrane receptor for ferrienterochelin and colicins
MLSDVFERPAADDPEPATDENELENIRPMAILASATMNKSRTFRRATSFVAPFNLSAGPGWIPPVAVLLLLLATISQAADTGTNQAELDLTELPLETLMEMEIPTVYGASKFEQKATEAPSSITVVTSDEIKQYGHRTLADVLQSAPGLHVSYDRNYRFLGFRGVNLGDLNSRVLVLVNGHRVNNNLSDGAYLGTEAVLDIDLVDRVEIIRGPGSVLYGNNAFFGVINVVTREGKQLNGTEVSGEYGSYETCKGRLSFGHQFTNGVQVLFSGTIYNSAGPDQLYYKEFATNNNGIAQEMDGDQYGNFFGSLSYADFTLSGAYSLREKVNPTAPLVYQYGFNDPRLKTTDERSYVSLNYARSFPELFDVSARVYYDRADYRITLPFTAFDFLYKERQVGEWCGTELQLQKKLWDKHIVTLGGEYRDDFRQDWLPTDPATGNIATNAYYGSRRSYGFYAEGEFTLLRQLRFNGGVRYDQYGDFDPAVNPRLALIYNPFEKSTLKALYGTAFRAPNFRELSDPEIQNIEPEEITAYELVYEQEITRWLRSSASGYYNQMDSLIIWENGQFANLDADTRGLELSLSGAWTNGLRGRLSYSLQKTEDRSGDRSLPDSPEHLVKLNLSVPVFRDKVFAGLEFLYTSRRATVYSTSDGSATLPGSDTDDFAIVNLTLFSQNLVKNLEFSASVYNLFDCRYADPSTRYHLQDSIEQDGRTFRLKLTCRF